MSDGNETNNNKNVEMHEMMKNNHDTHVLMNQHKYKINNNDLVFKIIASTLILYSCITSTYNFISIKNTCNCNETNNNNNDNNEALFGLGLIPSFCPTVNDCLINITVPTNSPETQSPTITVSDSPTLNPTNNPFRRFPTRSPTDRPTLPSSVTPTSNPSKSPFRRFPTRSPTKRPILPSSVAPTSNPTNSPFRSFPTKSPTNRPLNDASNAPTNNPTNTPSESPSDGGLRLFLLTDETRFYVTDKWNTTNWYNVYPQQFDLSRLMNIYLHKYICIHIYI